MHNFERAGFFVTKEPALFIIYQAWASNHLWES